MDVYNTAIIRIIGMINWKKIKGYHKKLGILWEFPYDKETVRRTPSISELKDELKSLLKHVYQENLEYISHGSWIIFWDRSTTGIGDIRVIFRLVDFHFEENTSSKESLTESLKKALEKEDYEYAAILRDSLYKKE